MPMERAEALVLRTTDWSETSRIATLWTRERGKVRALAKGGRRLRSSFESALDLLTHCDIVLLHKSSGLDLVTEARVIEIFPHLRTDLGAYYGGCYVAELLADGTQDLDPHPVLFEAALTTLRTLGSGPMIGRQLARFEWSWLRELGVQPELDVCVGCGGTLDGGELAFSCEAGGVVCVTCRPKQQRRPLSAAAWHALRAVESETDWGESLQREVRPVLEQFVSYHLGRRPRSLAFLDRRE